MFSSGFDTGKPEIHFGRFLYNDHFGRFLYNDHFRRFLYNDHFGRFLYNDHFGRLLYNDLYSNSCVQWRFLHPTMRFLKLHV
jgi:hypothetical protein